MNILITRPLIDSEDLMGKLFSDSGNESFEYELVGRDVDAAYIGKSVGEKLLSLAGTKFKKK